MSLRNSQRLLVLRSALCTCKQNNPWWWMSYSPECTYSSHSPSSIALINMITGPYAIDYNEWTDALKQLQGMKILLLLRIAWHWFPLGSVTKLKQAVLIFLCNVGGTCVKYHVTHRENKYSRKMQSNYKCPPSNFLRSLLKSPFYYIKGTLHEIGSSNVTKDLR